MSDTTAPEPVGDRTPRQGKSAPGEAAAPTGAENGGGTGGGAEKVAADGAAAQARSPSQTLELLSPAQREAMEKLSLNLARAAMTAQGAIAEAALRQADRPAGLTPDPFHVAPALTEVMARLAAQPDRLIRAQADLFGR
ncbi:MAG: class I poly(R)-hydroxyalkanoic acid synthase, partial [Caulobacteraceae bacterium]